MSQISLTSEQQIMITETITNPCGIYGCSAVAGSG